MNALFVSGQSLPEGSTDRTTVCAETFLRGSCPFGEKIAVKDVQYGTKQCTLSSDASGCCDYDSTDCLTDYTGTAQQAACSGRDLCNEVTIGHEDTSSCGAPYSDLNHYLTMEYYCISGKFNTTSRNLLRHNVPAIDVLLFRYQSTKVDIEWTRCSSFSTEIDN